MAIPARGTLSPITALAGSRVQLAFKVKLRTAFPLSLMGNQLLMHQAGRDLGLSLGRIKSRALSRSLALLRVRPSRSRGTPLPGIRSRSCTAGIQLALDLRAGADEGDAVNAGHDGLLDDLARHVSLQALGDVLVVGATLLLDLFKHQLQNGRVDVTGAL